MRRTVLTVVDMIVHPTFLLLLILAIVGELGTVEYIPQLVAHTADAAVAPAGKLMGFVHGCLVIPAFLLKLFDNTVVIYATYNMGTSYDSGYVVGVLMFGWLYRIF